MDTISTDLHFGNITAQVRAISDVMSKLLHVGMGVNEIIEKVTAAPCRMLGLKDKELEVREGMTADLTFYRVEEGRYTLSDSYRNEESSTKRIRAVAGMLGKRFCQSRECIFYKAL